MKKASLKKIHLMLKGLCFVLSLCFIVTSAILFYRLTRSVQPDLPAIVLTFEETEEKNPSNGGESTAGAPTGNESFYRKTFNPGFEVVDDKGIWVAETPVEIFKISYENGEQQVTVDGGDDKVIAPGTANTYSFTLKNTGNVPLDYTMSTEVVFSDPDLRLPVNVRMKDYNGGYLCGDAEKMEHASVLNSVSDSATLAAYTNAIYSLEWEWPFESGGAEADAYDTMLGDLAVERDITMTVIIRTRAEADIPAEGPDTGDDTNLTMMIAVAAIALALLVVLLILPRIKKKGEEPDGEESEESKEE